MRFMRGTNSGNTEVLMVIPRVLAKVTGNLHQSHCAGGEAGGPGGVGGPPSTPGVPPHARQRGGFYHRADGPARARGKVLPWDKKLTLANGKFTACIFIFLILAPSASNWCPTSPAFYLQDAAEVLAKTLACSSPGSPRSPCNVPWGPQGKAQAPPTTSMGLTLSMKPPKKWAPARRA